MATHNIEWNENVQTMFKVNSESKKIERECIITVLTQTLLVDIYFRKGNFVALISCFK